jgi:hypothetical protein
MKKIFSILALTLVALTASAKSDVFNLKDATATADKHGQVTFLVNGTSTETAAEGQTVTVSIAPDGGYIVTSVSNLCTTSWGGARAASMDMLNSVEMTKVNDNTYTFTMPRADVDVTVVYDIQIPTEADETKDESKDVPGVKLDMEPAGAPETIGGITIIPVAVTAIEVPQQATQTEITVVVNATTQVGSNIFAVKEIKADAFKTTAESKAIVTKVVLPETAQPIDIEAGAMKPNGKLLDVETPLYLLDDYSLMASLKENYEAIKITSKATAPERFWTFSSGVDVQVPEGVTVYRAFTDGGTIRILPIDEANESKVIKANNGVLLSCNEMKGGKAYTFVANPSGPKSGTPVATTDANSYGNNNMEPVIESKNYASGQYPIVKNNESHTIANNNSMVPACKAVFNKNK